MTDGQKLAGIREKEWKEIEDSDGDFREWQPELIERIDDAMVEEKEVVGKYRRDEMKKEERLKERFRPWDNIELMKPYEKDEKEESNLQASLREAKMTEEELMKKDRRNLQEAGFFHPPLPLN